MSRTIIQTNGQEVSQSNPLPIDISDADKASASGGGNNTYSNASGDFIATPTNNTKNIVLSSYASTVLSSVIGLKNFINGSVVRVKADGTREVLPMTNLAFSSNTLTLADMTTNFATTDTVVVTLVGPDKAFDETNDQAKVTLNTAIASNADSIAARLATDVVQDGLTSLTPKFAAISASGSGNNTIVAAVTGKKIRVLEFALSFSGTVNAKFQSAAGGTDLTGLFYGAANSQVPGSFNPLGKFETASGALLNLNLSAAVAVGGYVVYVEV